MKCPKCNHEGEERDFYDHYGDYECPICGYIEGDRTMNDKEEIWDKQLERVYDAMADVWIMIWTGAIEQ